MKPNVFKIYRSLDALIRLNECELIQKRRAKNVALYERFSPSGKTAGYEVVIVRAAPGKNEFGETKQVEFYPSPEEFGEFGWSFSTYREAEQKMKSLSHLPGYEILTNEAH